MSQIYHSRMNSAQMRSELLAMAEAGNTVAIKVKERILSEKSYKLTGIDFDNPEKTKMESVTALRDEDIIKFYQLAKMSFANRSTGSKLWSAGGALLRGVKNLFVSTNPDGSISWGGTLFKVGLAAAAVAAMVAAPVVLPALIGASAAATTIFAGQVVLGIASAVQVVMGAHKFLSGDDERAYDGLFDIGMGAFGAYGSFAAAGKAGQITQNAKAINGYADGLAQLGNVADDAGYIGRFTARVKGLKQVGFKNTYTEMKALMNGGELKKAQVLSDRLGAKAIQQGLDKDEVLSLYKALAEGNHKQALKLLSKAKHIDPNAEGNLRVMGALEELGLNKILDSHYGDALSTGFFRRGRYTIKNASGKRIYLDKATAQPEVIGIKTKGNNYYVKLRISGQGREQGFTGWLKRWTWQGKKEFSVEAKLVIKRSSSGDDVSVLFEQSRGFGINNPFRRPELSWNPLRWSPVKSPFRWGFPPFKSPFRTVNTRTKPTAKLDVQSIDTVEDASKGLKLMTNPLGQSQADVIARALNSRGIQNAEVIASKINTRTIGGQAVSEYIVAAMNQGDDASSLTSNIYKIIHNAGTGKTSIVEVADVSKYAKYFSRTKASNRLAFNIAEPMGPIPASGTPLKPVVEVLDESSHWENAVNAIMSGKATKMEGLLSTDAASSISRWFQSPFYLSSNKTTFFGSFWPNRWKLWGLNPDIKVQNPLPIIPKLITPAAKTAPTMPIIDRLVQSYQSAAPEDTDPNADTERLLEATRQQQALASQAMNPWNNTPNWLYSTGSIGVPANRI